MKNLRIALGIRNTHSLRRNLLYSAYEGYAKLKSTVTPSLEDVALGRQLKKVGIAKLGISGVDDLARIVEEKLAEVPLINGYAQLPRRFNPLLVPHLFRILKERGGGHRGLLPVAFLSQLV